MYRDRIEAGKALRCALSAIPLPETAMVLAIPRGGVVVGWQIAQDLNLDLDIVMTKKIGAPSNPEYAIGAVDPDGEVLLSWYYPVTVPQDYIQGEAKSLKTELARRLKELRGEAPFPDLRSRSVILVDDGLATGLTARSAGQYLRRHGAKQVILASPVASQEAVEALSPHFNAIVVPLIPDSFYAVGQWYQDFSQVSDEEVKSLLRSAPPKAH